jgi:hypothetical protein
MKIPILVFQSHPNPLQLQSYRSPVNDNQPCAAAAMLCSFLFFIRHQEPLCS